ncbi:Ig-like domain-containing protein [Salinisphaera sp.]|uniref:Ig-like domain-containing protein n=1 Tax=Salinisphaera sp. TaxID=1914330 RepID=UPI000C45345B|nr:Ig-like domain-containing protein [Salinisphaera sp.]MAS10088.1 hypothetical protein [Salinisphaera sp.]
MTAHTLRNLLLAIAIATLLVACGGSTSGGDDDDGGSSDGGGGDSTLETGVSLIASSNNLPSNASTNALGIQITAVVRDSNNNVAEGQAVSFSADSGALQVIENTTDNSGTATALLTTGGDPSNRTITVTGTVGGNTDTVAVEVVGTQLTVMGPPALAIGDSGTYTASLTDAGGDGVANQAVNIASANGNTLSMNNPQTNASGQAQFTLTATNPGTDTLSASALGETAQKQIEIAGDDFQFTAPADGTQTELNTPETITLRWLNNGAPVTGQTIDFSTTRGTLSDTSVDTDANGEASVSVSANNAGPATVTASSAGGLQTTTSLQFIATQPDSIDVQADPATVSPGGQSTITAIVRDANNNLVTGETVSFTLNDTSGGSLADGSGVTNTNGVASTTYTAGSTSASQPAEITATVNSTTGISKSVLVSIGGQALRITLGTGNELAEPSSTTYQLPYVAIVTDANGVPAPDASFRLSIESVAYQKGSSGYVDTDDDGNPDAFSPTYAVTNSNGFGCFNEDLNRNGVLDSGEDINGNDTLDPGNVATVPQSVDLDDNGTAEFNVTYPQNFAQWVQVRLKAIANVQGTETTATALFILPVLAEDVDDQSVAPPNQTSPFGVMPSCADEM